MPATKREVSSDAKDLLKGIDMAIQGLDGLAWNDKRKALRWICDHYVIDPRKLLTEWTNA